MAFPLRGELRYGLELARLTADREFVLPRRQPNAMPISKTTSDCIPFVVTCPTAWRWVVPIAAIRPT